MCLYPKLIKNRKYTANKKNGGIVPAITDKRTELVPVGCGKCMECMKKKATDWRVRLLEEVREKKNGIMITLTFSNKSIKELSEGIKLEGYELDNEIAKIAVRRFLERWRWKYKKSLRHWLVTELGGNGTENIHLHGIVWTDIEREEITRIWQYGFTQLGDNKGGGWVNEQTVNYIVKYIHKIDEKHKEYKPRVLTSSGIGEGYIRRMDAEKNKYKGKDTKETYTNRQGYKMGLPIYYRNKIYNEEEKEKLWLSKLDEDTRYVNGTKVSTKNGDEDYYRVREEARKKNKQLGYGDDEINWERRRYERERRIINHKKRKGK